MAAYNGYGGSTVDDVSLLLSRGGFTTVFAGAPAVAPNTHWQILVTNA